MNQTTASSRFSLMYLLIVFIAVIVTWLLHEAAHWAAGTALDYNMAMTLNSTFPTQTVYLNTRHEAWVSAAGPVFTLLQAVVIFLLMRKGNRPTLYPFLAVCLYMRLLAMGMSIIHPNDEARISSFLGLGTFTLPLLVVALMGWLVYRISKRYGFSRRTQIITYTAIMVVSSVLILLDQALHLRVL